MLKIGITGGIGAGKSTVSHIFELLGIPVFYSDDESKKILQTDDEAIASVKKYFGEDMYDSGILNRKKLARVVFSDPEKLSRLNALSHPAVFRKFRSWIKEQLNVPYVMKEAALIYETGADKDLGKVIVVIAPEPLRIQRIMRRDHVNETEVRNRMNRQWSEEAKIERADYYIYNDEERFIIPQVLEVHKEILKLI